MNELQIIQLVEAARSGDRDAFGLLVEQYESMVFGIVMARLRNRSEAKEVTQDVFVQAMRKLPQLREAERFVGWLRQIAVRMSINRAVRRPNEAICGPDTFAGVESEPRDPLVSLMQQEQASQVRDGLDRLRDLDRETLWAFYFEGRSLKEMADDFESPIGTIKRRLHTARNRLRDELVGMADTACAG